jgi:hypothetical protein
MRLPCALARTPIPIRDKPQNLTGRKQAEERGAAGEAEAPAEF